MVWACIEKKRIYGDGGAREKKEKKTEAEVIG